MIIRVEYKTEEEYQSLLEQYKTMPYIKVENLFEGNFLTFSDEPIHKQVIYTQVDEEEFNRIKEENQQLQKSLLEMTTYSESQDERLATQEQALLELTTLVAGGNA